MHCRDEPTAVPGIGAGLDARGGEGVRHGREDVRRLGIGRVGDDRTECGDCLGTDRRQIENGRCDAAPPASHRQDPHVQVVVDRGETVQRQQRRRQLGHRLARPGPQPGRAPVLTSTATAAAATEPPRNARRRNGPGWPRLSPSVSFALTSRPLSADARVPCPDEGKGIAAVRFRKTPARMRQRNQWSHCDPLGGGCPRRVAGRATHSWGKQRRVLPRSQDAPGQSSA